MDYQVLTNNPLVEKTYASKCDLRYEEKSVLELFSLARDLIQKGHKLLTHPLAGSLKPNETPYRTLLLSKTIEGRVDSESEIIIEECILATKKFPVRSIVWPQAILEDFQYVDFTLISNVLAVHG